METLTVPRAVIDPEALRGTTLLVKRVESPWQTFVAVIQEPLVMAAGRRASIIRDRSEGDGYVVSWDVVLQGGKDRGLEFNGMEEELRLRFLPQKRIT